MSEKIKRFLTGVFTIEHLIHAVMVAVAFGSFGTLRDWLGHGHSVITQYAVAGGLSAGLVAVSIMLSKVDFNDRQTRNWMLSAVVSVALLSGTIQSIAYYEAAVCHVESGVQTCEIGTWGTLFKSTLQGYGFPLVFEGLLAYAAAMFAAADKRKRAAEAADSSNLDRKMDLLVSEAVSGINIDSMADEVEQIAKQHVRRKLMKAFARLDATDNSNEKPTGKQGENSGSLQEIAVTRRPGIEELNEKRRQAIADRRTAIVDLLTALGPLTTAAIVAHLRDDRGIT